MATITQRSFAGGELSPSLRARVDLQKYSTAAATLRNFQVMRYGGASNRAGSQFIGEVKDSTKRVRLIPFVFNNDQTYVLEFGNLYMRVIKKGMYINKTLPASIVSVTAANPGVFTYNTAVPVAVGDQLTFSGGFTQLAGRPVVVATSSGSTFTLKYLDGTNVDTTGFGAFSPTTAAITYTLLTPYLESELPTLQFIQSADVMTFTHQAHQPLNLSRYADNNWEFQNKSFSPGYPIMTFNAFTVPSGSVRQYYKATITDRTTGIESLPNSYIFQGISAITKASPAKVTSFFAHNLSTGDRVFINSPYMPSLTGRVTTITVVDSTNFTLDDTDTTVAQAVGSPNPYISQVDASVTDYFQRDGLMVTAATPTTTAPIVLRFNPFNGSTNKNKTVTVYKLKNGVFGFLGSVDLEQTLDFKDVGLDSDTADTPPVIRNPFADLNYPAAVAYIQQRLVFANTPREPEKIWTSRTGKFNDFTTSTPSQDDQAITFTMAGRQVNAVRYLLDVGQFVVLTSGGEWLIQGDNGVLTPVGINPKQSSYYGSAEGMAPIIIGNSALYVQARGSIIRDLAYNYQSEGYTGNDLTIYSSHLFDKFVLKDWCYQQVPHSIVWTVRDDGTLLGLTYLKEQQMLAWHRHDTDGAFENVTSIPEGNEDVLYAVIRRVVNGRTVRYVERFATRKVLDLRDSKYMDAHLSYDGRNTTATTLTISGGTTWGSDELLTLTASSALFNSTDVGNQIQFNGFRFTITQFTSSTVVQGYSEKNVAPAFQNVATAVFTKAVKRISGLWHLEGKPVSIIGDGYTVSSPNNPDIDTLTVANGMVTLDKPYGVITVGLAYVSDLETLDVDSVQSETLADKRMTINRVTLSVEETIGGFIGAQAPSPSEGMIDHLMELKTRSFETLTQGNMILTGKRDVSIESNWQTNGRIFIRQVDPLPISILSVSIAGLIPFRQG